MHIVMISDVYFPRVNGVSTSISVFRQELQALGHRVSLVVPAYGDAQESPDLYRVPSRYLILDPEDRAMRYRALRRVCDRLAAESVDVVHIQTPFLAHYAGLRLARRLGIPVVESYHTFFEEYLDCYVPLVPRSWLRAFARTFTRRQCNAVDGIIVPSSAMDRTLKRYGVTTPTTVLPTGIELAEFSIGDGARFRKRHAIAPDQPILLYVGRVAFEKNIGFLLEMFARVRQQQPEALLVIAGEGPAVPALRKQARRLGLGSAVLFVGYLARDGGLQDCYRAGDLFVFASRTETQGLVLLEAMASGVPVVSTAVMGTRDVLRPSAGALVAEERVEDFADKVLELLGDLERRSAMARQALRYAESWSAQQLAVVLADYYARQCAAAVIEPKRYREEATDG